VNHFQHQPLITSGCVAYCDVEMVGLAPTAFPCFFKALVRYYLRHIPMSLKCIIITPTRGGY
jgi:hypothetical protein